MWDRITLFYSGLCIPSTKPCGKLLRSLELFKNPHKPHKLRASVFPLMSLRLTCMSWMRHISITFLMCQMSYFIIKYVCWGWCCIIKNQENILFFCSFHSVRKMHALPNSTSVLHFIYRLSYKRGKKVESKLWVQFWVESKLLLSSWLFFFFKSAYILFVSECLGHFQPGWKWKETVSVLWVLRGWYGMSQWSVSHILWRHRGPLWPHWLAVLSQWRVFLNGSATFCP